jgi:N6-adenosine-specific RNA methylase IME4
MPTDDSGSTSAFPDSDKKYKIIYADPPWKYRDTASAGERGAVHKYDVMPLGDIKRLPVASIAEPDSVLFLWVTMPFIKEGVEVIQSWGFTYKTVAFTWVKLNKHTKTPFMGMGNWTRSNAELCLLGVKGKPKRVSARVKSVILAPRGEHSAKPAETRDMIVTLVGDKPRIELFARERVPGWDAWGNEII